MANIRTQDYQGWLAASSSLRSGFMLWSGSCVDVVADDPGLTTTYPSNQIGMEFVANSESYIRWSSSAAGNGLDIRTNKFFVGNPNTSFINGYGNVVIISSSNFHLNATGDVTMQGTITANEGDIAGWKIQSDKLLSKGGTASAANPGIVLGSGGTIETNPFVSGLTANAMGWQIRADGRAEFENAVIRGTLSTAVFEKDTISVVGGQVMVANATKTDSPELRFQPYPWVKSPHGENHNYSGETLPDTGSNQTNGSVYITFGGTLTANNTLNSDLWWKLTDLGTNGSSNVKLNIPISHSADPVGTRYRLTYYGHSGSKDLQLSAWNNNAGASFAFTKSDGTIVSGGATHAAPVNGLDQVNAYWFTKRADWGTGTNTPILIFRPSGGYVSGSTCYVRDIQIIKATQSLVVDNAGGFQTGSEILVAKAVDQGPDGREGFVREYMLCVSKSLGKSAVPASASVSFGSGLPSTIHVTASEIHTFIGQTGTLSTDTVYNNTYYYASSSTLSTNLINLKQKINAEVKDVFVNVTNSVGSSEGTIDALYMQAVGAEGLDGNAYKLHTTLLSGAEARIKPQIGVERNMDARVSGNGRGYWIENISDGQTIASQGGEGTGYILLNAQPTDTYTPYIDVVERKNVNLGKKVQAVDVNGYPSDVDSTFGEVNTIARLGDLSGITDYSFSDGVSGYGLYTSNGYFKGKIEVASFPNFPPIPASLHYNFGTQTGSKVLNMTQTNPTIGSSSIANIGTAIPWSSVAADKDSVTGNSALYLASGSGNYLQGAYVGWYYPQAASNYYGTGNMQDYVSVAMWIKPASGSTGFKVLWENGGTSNGHMLWLSGSTLGFSVWEGNGSTTYAATYSCITSSAWNHVAATWKTGTGSLYHNAIRKVKSTSHNNLGSVTAFSGKWGIGAVFNNSKQVTGSGTGSGLGTNITTDGKYQFTGSMDEVKIWYDYILQDHEVEALKLYPNGDTALGGTIIEGGRIQTGRIQSNNWSAQSGSEINLDTSEIMLGGSNSPKLHWNPATNNLNIQGTITLGAGSTLPDGTPISSVRNLQVSPSSNLYTFASASDTSPDTNDITVTVQMSGFSSSISASDISFTTADSSVMTVSASSMLTASFSSGSGESTFVLSFASSSTGPHLNASKAKLPLLVTVTSHDRTDSTNIVALNGGVQGADGLSALEALLTQPNIVLPSTGATGQVSDFSDSGTQLHMFEGTGSLSYNGTGNTNGTWKVVRTPSNIAEGTIVDSGTYATMGNITAFSASSATGSISYLVTGKRFAGAAFTRSYTQSFTKAPQGIDGIPGVSPRKVEISSSQGYVFVYPSTGTASATPNQTILKAVPTNNTNSGHYTWYKNGTSSQAGPSDQYTYTPPATRSLAPEQIKVEFRDGPATNNVAAIDQSSFYGIQSGTDAITVALTNENVSVPFSGSFDFSDSGTDILVWRGAVSLSYDDALSANDTFRVERTMSNIQEGAASTVSTYTRRFADITAFSASTNTGNIKHKIKVRDDNGFIGKTLVRTQSFSKVFSGNDGAAGAPGTPARMVSMSLAGAGEMMTITYDEEGANPSPATISFTCAQTGSVGTPYFQWFVGTTSQGNPNTVAAGSGSFTFTCPNTHSLMPETIKVEMRDGGAGNPVVSQDYMSAQGIKLGRGAVTVENTNQMHVFSAYANNNVTGYGGGGTTIKATYDGQYVPYDSSSPYTTPSFRVVSATGNTISVGTATTVGNNRVFGNPSSFSMSADSASIDYVVAVVNGAGGTVYITSSQNFAKSKAGAPGTDGADGNEGLINAQGAVTFSHSANADGLYLGSQSLGFYTTSLAGGAAGFASYIDNQGQFYLKGSEGSGLAWANDKLLVDGSVMARAIRQIPVVINQGNRYSYVVTHSAGTITEAKCCTIYLDGRVTAGTYNGTHNPSATPDPAKISRHVIVNLNCITIGTDGIWANSLPSIVNIVAPDLLDDGAGNQDNALEIIFETSQSITQGVQFIAPTQSAVYGSSGFSATLDALAENATVADMT